MLQLRSMQYIQHRSFGRCGAAVRPGVLRRRGIHARTSPSSWVCAAESATSTPSYQQAARSHKEAAGPRQRDSRSSSRGAPTAASGAAPGADLLHLARTLVDGEVVAVVQTGVLVRLPAVGQDCVQKLRFADVTFAKSDDRTPEDFAALFRRGDRVRAVVEKVEPSGRLRLSTRYLEPQAGDMLVDPQRVYATADEVAEAWRQKQVGVIEARKRAVEERGIKVGQLVEGVVVHKSSRDGVKLDIGGGAQALLHHTQITRAKDVPPVPELLQLFGAGGKVVALVSSLRETGGVLLSTALLERSPGDMLRDPQAVYAGAEEAAAEWRRQVQVSRMAAVFKTGSVVTGVVKSKDPSLGIWVSLPAAESGGEAPALLPLSEISLSSDVPDAEKVERFPVAVGGKVGALVVGVDAPAADGDSAVVRLSIAQIEMRKGKRLEKARSYKATVMHAGESAAIWRAHGRSQPASVIRLTYAKAKVGDILEGVVKDVVPRRYMTFRTASGYVALLPAREITAADESAAAPGASSEDSTDSNDSGGDSDPTTVFRVGDRVRAAITALRPTDYRVTLSTAVLERTPGDMLRDPQAVYAGAEEAAAEWRRRALHETYKAGAVLPATVAARRGPLGTWVKLPSGLDGVHPRDVEAEGGDKGTAPAAKAPPVGGRVRVEVVGADESLDAVRVRLLPPPSKQPPPPPPRPEEAERALAALTVGQVVDGTVENVKPYGVFVRLAVRVVVPAAMPSAAAAAATAAGGSGGAAGSGPGGSSSLVGMLHISQISKDRVKDITAVLRPGDAMRVMVLSVDSADRRVTLSTKQLERTPGDMLRDPQAVYAGAEEAAAEWRARRKATLGEEGNREATEA